MTTASRFTVGDRVYNVTTQRWGVVRDLRPGPRYGSEWLESLDDDEQIRGGYSSEWAKQPELVAVPPLNEENA
jgi:hypothetical protein